MTGKQIEKEAKIIKEFGQELLSNSEKADNFFIEMGVYTKDGKLTKEYGGG